MSSLPSFGMVVTLIAWGWVVDRVGERIVLALGSALTAAAAFAAAAAHSLVAVGVFLFLGGMAAASSNSASGRLVVGWFPAASARPDDGHPPDGSATGSRLGRVGDSPAGRAQRSRRRAAVPRDRVRGRRGDQCGRRARPAAPAARRGAAGTTWPTRTGVVDAVAHPRGVGAAGRAAVRGLDVHAGVADDRPRLVGRRRRAAGHGRPGARCAGRIAAGRWSDRVGSRLHPVRTIALAAALSMGLLAVDRLRSTRRSPSPCWWSRRWSRCQRQRLGVHRDRRDSPGRSGAAGRWAPRTPVSCSPPASCRRRSAP